VRADRRPCYPCPAVGLYVGTVKALDERSARSRRRAA